MLELVLLNALLVQNTFLYLLSLFQQLANSIDRIIISWLAFMRCFIDSDIVEHVNLVALVNENLILVFLELDIPRIK